LVNGRRSDESDRTKQGKLGCGPVCVKGLIVGEVLLAMPPEYLWLGLGIGLGVVEWT
jgi:hypothetical protein